MVRDSHPTAELDSTMSPEFLQTLANSSAKAVEFETAGVESDVALAERFEEKISQLKAVDLSVGIVERVRQIMAAQGFDPSEQDAGLARALQTSDEANLRQFIQEWLAGVELELSTAGSKPIAQLAQVGPAYTRYLETKRDVLERALSV